jgi:hypothetical protein
MNRHFETPQGSTDRRRLGAASGQVGYSWGYWKVKLNRRFGAGTPSGAL